MTAPHRRRLLIPLTLALPLSCALGSRPARACTAGVQSIVDRSPRSIYGNADHVFRGTVESYREPLLLNAGRWGLPSPVLHAIGFFVQPQVEMTLRVDEAWKGSVDRRMTLYSSDSSCGVGFRGAEPGDELLVFAYADEGRLTLSAGHRPVPVDHEWAVETLDWLGPGRTQLPRDHSTTVLLFGLVALTLGLGLIPLWRRRIGTPATSPSPR